MPPFLPMIVAGAQIYGALKGAKGPKGGSAVTTTMQQTDPWLKGLLSQNLDRARAIADRPFQPYTGQRIAPFNPTQNYARGMALGAVGVAARPRPLTAAGRETQPPQPFGMPLGAVAPAPFTGALEPTGRQTQPPAPAGSAGRTGPDYDSFVRNNPMVERDFQQYAAPIGMAREDWGRAYDRDWGAGDGLDVPQFAAAPTEDATAPAYEEAFSYDPSGAAGARTLDQAMAATRGVLGAGVPRFEGVRLGAAPVLGPLEQAGFERFGGARLSPAAQAQGRDITADVIDRAAVRDALGGTAAGGIGQYLNPYLDEVVGRATADIERSRALQQLGNDSRAAGARAFGSRNDIVTAETNRAALDAAGRTAAELRARGFDVALGASQEDMARALQAQIANIGSDLAVLGRNQDATLQERLANQADARAINLANTEAKNRFALTQGEFDQQAGINNAQLSAQTSIFNAGQVNEGRFRDLENRARYGLAQGEFDQQAGLANQRAALDYGQLALGAGAQLGGFAATQRANALGDAGVVAGLGQQEQGLTQAEYDFLYEQHLAALQHPFIGQQLLNSSLGMLPNAGTTTTNAPGPDRFAQLLGAGSQVLGDWIRSRPRGGGGAPSGGGGR